MLTNLQECGDLILRINEAAYGEREEDFQSHVLHDIDRVIGFDRAWWGIMSPTTDGGFGLLGSYRANLPESYVEHWNDCSPDDRLARSVNDAPARTVRFNTQQLHSTPGLYEINAAVGNKHALCTAIKLPERGGDFLFVSLFRGGRSRCFDQDEAWAKQFLMPHVFMAWKHNLVRNQNRAADDGGDSGFVASAFIDLKWGVLEGSAAFMACMSKAWPAWQPPILPASLIDALRVGTDHAIVAGMKFSVATTGGIRRLVVSRVRALDSLTPRECEVALAFSSGQSYKEVARTLGLSPATVRHYLREIYMKLELTDKAELANRINGG